MECASAPSPLPSLSLSPLLFTIPLGDPFDTPPPRPLPPRLLFFSISRHPLPGSWTPPTNEKERREEKRGRRRGEECASVGYSGGTDHLIHPICIPSMLPGLRGMSTDPAAYANNLHERDPPFAKLPYFRISLSFLSSPSSFFFFSAYIGDWLLEIMLIRVESRLDSRQTRCRLSSLSLFLRTFIKNDAESSIITDDRGKRRTRLPCTRVESTTQFGEKRERERESG